MSDIYSISGIRYVPNSEEISILFVGNSLTQDGIAYLPYLLKTYYPEINFRFYMWYNGGYTCAQQYTDFQNNATCEIFSRAENVAAWTNQNRSVTMADVLSTYTFNIVCVQEYFNYKETYTATTDFENVVEYIRANYQGGNALKFITLFHAPLRSKVDDVFALTKSGIELILKNTVCEDVLSNGIAVYKALSTDLDSLGDKGHLSPDGTHTQEGLPCLMQTFTALLWFLEKAGINVSIYGSAARMTTAVYNTIKVPGANLGSGVIPGTDAENYLAQAVAIEAFKAGKNLVSGVDYFS